MKLLVAVDLAANPEAVIEEAARWADRLAGTVDLLHVDETPDSAVFVGDPNVRAILVQERERLVAEHAAKLEELLQRLPEPRRGTATVVPGLPAEVILEAAPRYDAILVATHGRRGLSHLWLGSVAEKVVRFAPVPVIVTRLPAP